MVSQPAFPESTAVPGPRAEHTWSLSLRPKLRGRKQASFPERVGVRAGAVSVLRPGVGPRQEPSLTVTVLWAQEHQPTGRQSRGFTGIPGQQLRQRDARGV